MTGQWKEVVLMNLKLYTVYNLEKGCVNDGKSFYWNKKYIQNI